MAPQRPKMSAWLPSVLLLLAAVGNRPSSAQEVQVAATSDSRIDYSSSWTLTQGKQSHITNTMGATATFTFNGVYIAMRSTKSSTQGVEKMTLDGQDYSVDCSWPDASVSGDTAIVFEKKNLAATEHTITFTKLTSIDKSAVVWDFWYIPSSEVTSAAKSSSSATPDSTPSSSSSSSSEEPTSSPSTSQTSRQSQQEQQSNSTPGTQSSASSTSSVSSTVTIGNLFTASTTSTSLFGSPSNASLSSDEQTSGTDLGSSAGAGSKGKSSHDPSAASASELGSSGTPPVNSASTHDDTPYKIMVGAIIAAVALLVILSVLLTWFCIRRKRARKLLRQLQAEGVLGSGAQGRNGNNWQGEQSIFNPDMRSARHSIGVTSTIMSTEPTPAQVYASQAMQEAPASPDPAVTSIAGRSRHTRRSEAPTKPPTYRTGGVGRPIRPADLAVLIEDPTGSVKRGLAREKSTSSKKSKSSGASTFAQVIRGDSTNDDADSISQRSARQAAAAFAVLLEDAPESLRRQISDGKAR